MNTDRARGPVPKVRPRRNLTEMRLHDLESRLVPISDPIVPLAMVYRQGDRVHDDDLVTLVEFCTLAGLERTRLTRMAAKQYAGEVDYDFPPPKVQGLSVKLWSARELAYWWNRR